MKLLTAQQIGEWDHFTIKNEPISSADLMERAASACIQPILYYYLNRKSTHVAVFCGRGNNGGDGLVIARLLLNHGYHVSVYFLSDIEKCSHDFKHQLNTLDLHFPHVLNAMKDAVDFPVLKEHELIIDALTGIGFQGEVKGLLDKLIRHINKAKGNVISIDLPSGMPSEWPEHLIPGGQNMIQADLLLTFQQPKRSLLHPESSRFYNKFEVLDIGLHIDFPKQAHTPYYYIDRTTIQSYFIPINQFAHKGTKGHLLTIGGSIGKVGASVLMTRAALRTGCGLVSSVIPGNANIVMQTAVPEVMTIPVNAWDYLHMFPSNISTYQSISVGPGLGQQEETIIAFKPWLAQVDLPIVLDADALNIISRYIQEDPKGFRFPKHCIITPHPKEFDRLAGPSVNSIERLEKQIRMAEKYEIVVVLKGAFTTIALPDGRVFYNSTGNAAMATGGTGDVLTGMVGSLMAQGYSTEHAALMAVYMHGLAGDEVAKTQATLMASDLIQQIPLVIKQLRTKV